MLFSFLITGRWVKKKEEKKNYIIGNHKNNNNKKVNCHILIAITWNFPWNIRILLFFFKNSLFYLSSVVLRF